jgi:two-component system, NarL family, sensor kinase
MFYKDEIILSIAITTAVVLLLAVFIVFFIFQLQRRKQKHRAEKQLLQSQYQQDLLRTQLEIQEQTLKTIGEEIHDNIGQVLSLVKLNLNTLNNLPDAAQQKADTTKELVSKVISDLRQLSRSLHGDKIGEIGLKEAIEGQLRIIENSGQFAAKLTVAGTERPLEPQQEMVLYRMVQEILNNAVKHSKATQLNVALLYEPGEFTLTITDNGIGFDASKLEASKTGIGLKNIYNRAALIGAVLKVNSSPGNGTIVSIILPGHPL